MDMGASPRKSAELFFCRLLHSPTRVAGEGDLIAMQQLFAALISRACCLRIFVLLVERHRPLLLSLCVCPKGFPATRLSARHYQTTIDRLAKEPTLASWPRPLLSTNSR